MTEDIYTIAWLHGLCSLAVLRSRVLETSAQRPIGGRFAGLFVRPIQCSMTSVGFA